MLKFIISMLLVSLSFTQLADAKKKGDVITKKMEKAGMKYAKAWYK